MSTGAIVLLVLSMVLLWGGLGLAVLNLIRNEDYSADRHNPDTADAPADRSQSRSGADSVGRDQEADGHAALNGSHAADR